MSGEVVQPTSVIQIGTVTPALSSILRIRGIRANELLAGAGVRAGPSSGGAGYGWTSRPFTSFAARRIDGQ